MKEEELTAQIIKAFFTVYNILGYGFLEKVYENAMVIELTEMGLNVERQKKILVYYKQHVVGDYSSDLVVNSTVICELKSNEILISDDERQLVNYLKGTKFEIGLLLNFGKKAEIKRKMYDNNKKAWINSHIKGLDLDNTNYPG